MASPLMTMFGGACCTPMALRRSPSTTTILVYAVTIMATNGSNPIANTIAISGRNSVGCWLFMMDGQMKNAGTEPIAHRHQFCSAYGLPECDDLNNDLPDR